jgi:hypothetical protein
MRVIADCGLPIKISTQWTEDQYQDHDEFDYIKSTTVKGWRVRINGRVYPRNHVNGDGTDDWTYRYTPREGRTEAGRRIAIKNALLEAGLTVKEFETEWSRAQ